MCEQRWKVREVAEWGPVGRNFQAECWNSKFKGPEVSVCLCVPGMQQGEAKCIRP